MPTSVKKSQSNAGRISAKLLLVIFLAVVVLIAVWVFMNNTSNEAEPLIDESQLVPQEVLPPTGPTELKPL